MNYTQKISSFILTGILLISFNACKKAPTTTVNPDLVGIWKNAPATEPCILFDLS